MTARDELCSWRGVCICLSATVLSCIYILGPLGCWRTWADMRSFLCPPSPRICCQSLSVLSLWSSQACILPIKKMVPVCKAHLCSCGSMHDLFLSSILSVWNVSSMHSLFIKNNIQVNFQTANDYCKVLFMVPRTKGLDTQPTHATVIFMSSLLNAGPTCTEGFSQCGVRTFTQGQEHIICHQLKDFLLQAFAIWQSW